MLNFAVSILAVFNTPSSKVRFTKQPHTTSHDKLLASGRRQLLAGALATVGLGALPTAAPAIVNGIPMGDAEAAAVGAVGLYIDLSGCAVCRQGIPATCTATLVAPDLVLSARHCADIPQSLNGTLQKVVFAANMLDPAAQSREVERVVSPEDYGIDSAGNDLLLIKIKGVAPAPWKPVELPLSLLPLKAEQAEAAAKGSPFFPAGVGMPTVFSYGYGQQSTEGEKRVDKFKAGELRRISLDVRTEIRPWAPGFLATPSVAGTGTCAGDSGGGVLLGLQDPGGRGVRQLLLGVQSSASKPCIDNQAIFVYPQAFSDFILRASRDLGSPITPTLSWRDYQ